MRKLDARQLAREKSLFRYSSALDRADFGTVAAVLHEAEGDPLLAQMIAEINLVYESEHSGLSPSLNHSSNHRKELLMTTLVIPNQQRPAQRWLPLTLAAACVSVVLLGLLMLRPKLPANWQAGTSPSATPTAAATATPIPTSTPMLFAAQGSMGEPTLLPPDPNTAASAANIAVCGGMTIKDGKAYVTNQTDRAATLYAAPLTLNSNANVVGELPAHADALLLNQQNDPQSDSIGGLWYLIMTGEAGNSQATGWVSANSIGVTQSCAAQASSAVAASPATTSSITVVPMSRCQIMNLSTQPTTLFAAPLTADSNAAAVGVLPANGSGLVLTQQYDMQSAPIGALWYQITVVGSSDHTITGWVSGSSVTLSGGCGVDISSTSLPETGSSFQIVTPTLIPAAIAAAPDLTVTVIPSAPAEVGICHVVNPQSKAMPVYSAPTSNTDESAVVNYLPSNVAATVLYQQRDSGTGGIWYLVLVEADQQKPISGWVAASSVSVADRCPNLP